MKRWKITIQAKDGAKNQNSFITFNTGSNIWSWNFADNCNLAPLPCASSNELLAGYITDNAKDLFDANYISEEINTSVVLSGESLPRTRMLTITFDIDDNKLPHWSSESVFFSLTVQDITIIDPPSFSSINIIDVQTSKSLIYPCINFRIAITADKAFNRVILPYFIDGFEESSMSFESSRGVRSSIITIERDETDGSVSSASSFLNYSIPEWDESDIEIVQNGVYTTINVNVNSLIFEMTTRPISDDKWYDENVFILTPGNHLLNVRDNWGCIVSKAFSVPEKEGYDVIHVSKSNSIRFKYENNLKSNDDNRLSCETIEEFNHKDVQMFEIGDLITTQVKSSYNVTFLYGDDYGGYQLTARKVTDYMGREDCLRVYGSTTNKGDTKIRFVGAKELSCTDGTEIGDVELTEGLPIWAKVGQLIAINDVNNDLRTIKFIGVDSEGNPYILIDEVMIGAIPNTTINVNYDLDSYEVWEADVIISSGDTNSKLWIIINTPEGNKRLISETIRAIQPEDSQLWTKIQYWMNHNTDMYYASGIRNLSYQLTLESALELDIEIDNYKTDTNVLQLDEQFYNLDKFKFDIRSKEISRNLALALSHNNVLINDVFYTGKTISVNKQGNSNLYLVEYTGYKRGRDLYIDQYTNNNPLGVKLIEGMPNQFISQ